MTAAACWYGQTRWKEVAAGNEQPFVAPVAHHGYHSETATQRVSPPSPYRIIAPDQDPMLRHGRSVQAKLRGRAQLVGAEGFHSFESRLESDRALLRGRFRYFLSMRSHVDGLGIADANLRVENDDADGRPYGEVTGMLRFRRGDPIHVPIPVRVEVDRCHPWTTISVDRRDSHVAIAVNDASGHGLKLCFGTHHNPFPHGLTQPLAIAASCLT